MGTLGAARDVVRLVNFVARTGGEGRGDVSVEGRVVGLDNGPDNRPEVRLEVDIARGESTLLALGLVGSGVTGGPTAATTCFAWAAGATMLSATRSTPVATSRLLEETGTAAGATQLERVATRNAYAATRRNAREENTTEQSSLLETSVCPRIRLTDYE